MLFHVGCIFLAYDPLWHTASMCPFTLIFPAETTLVLDSSLYIYDRSDCDMRLLCNAICAICTSAINHESVHCTCVHWNQPSCVRLKMRTMRRIASQYEQISVLLCTLTRSSNSPAVTGANTILMTENMFGNYTCRPRLCLIKGQSAEAHYITGRSK